jgi:hypothetical protein
MFYTVTLDQAVEIRAWFNPDVRFPDVHFAQNQHGDITTLDASSGEYRHLANRTSREKHTRTFTHRESGLTAGFGERDAPTLQQCFAAPQACVVRWRALAD